MKEKRARLPRICVVLVLILLLPILSSCAEDAPKLTMEEMQDRILIARQVVNTIAPDIPKEIYGDTMAYDTRVYTVLKAEHSYRGVEYRLTSLGYLENGGKLYYELTDHSPDTMYTFWGTDENGEKTCIHYFDEDGAPIGFTKAEATIYGTKREKFEEDDIVDVAEDFIDYFINDNSTDSIDISEYKLSEIAKQEDDSYSVRLKRCVNGVAVHEIRVALNNKCQVTGIKMSSRILDESVYAQIPELTDAQWAELAYPTIEYIFERSGYDAVFTDFRIRGELDDSLEYDDSACKLIYLHDKECYAVEFKVSFKASFADGTTTDDLKYHCYYTLDFGE